MTARLALARGVTVALVVWAVGAGVLVLVALFAPLLERCPWEKGQRFVRPRSHRSRGQQSCSMTAGWAPRGDVVRAHGVRV